jgi:hypothetical protein
MSKNWIIKVYISTFYVLTKLFHKKPTFFVACVEKTKFGVKKNVYMAFFLSFYTRHKMSFFMKLGVSTWNVET